MLCIGEAVVYDDERHCTLFCQQSSSIDLHPPSFTIIVPLYWNILFYYNWASYAYSSGYSILRVAISLLRHHVSLVERNGVVSMSNSTFALQFVLLSSVTQVSVSQWSGTTHYFVFEWSASSGTGSVMARGGDNKAWCKWSGSSHLSRERDYIFSHG